MLARRYVGSLIALMVRLGAFGQQSSDFGTSFFLLERETILALSKFIRLARPKACSLRSIFTFSNDADTKKTQSDEIEEKT
jgi:hypothetical protein